MSCSDCCEQKAIVSDCFECTISNRFSYFDKDLMTFVYWFSASGTTRWFCHRRGKTRISTFI